MATLADVRFQMRMLGYSGFLLTRGEVRELPSLLREGEKIEQAIYGGHEAGFGMMVATGHRLLFVDKRFFHKHISEISYPAISSVELDTNISRGSVTVFARGSTITLRGVTKRHARRFFNYIDSKIDTSTPEPADALVHQEDDYSAGVFLMPR